MSKSLILGLLLGLSTAHSITGWTSPRDAAEGGRHTIIEYENILTLTTFFEFDFGYQTHYAGHEPDEIAYGVQGETYGINFYSYGLINLDYVFLNTYYKNIRFYFEPIMIAPYSQTIYWTKPDLGNHFFLAAGRTIRAGDYITLKTENTAIGKKSFRDIFGGDKKEGHKWWWSTEEMFLEEDMVNKYVDIYRSDNIIRKISPKFFSKLNNHILGYHNYYDIQLF